MVFKGRNRKYTKTLQVNVFSQYLIGAMVQLHKNKTVSFFGPKGLLNDGGSRLSYANICILLGTNIGMYTEIEVIIWIMKQSGPHPYNNTCSLVHSVGFLPTLALYTDIP